MIGRNCESKIFLQKRVTGYIDRLYRLIFFKTISEKASKMSLIKIVKISRKAGIKKEEVPLMKKILSLALVLMLALIPMAVAEEFNPADYPVAICRTA